MSGVLEWSEATGRDGSALDIARYVLHHARGGSKEAATDLMAGASMGFFPRFPFASDATLPSQKVQALLAGCAIVILVVAGVTLYQAGKTAELSAVGVLVVSFGIQLLAGRVLAFHLRCFQWYLYLGALAMAACAMILIEKLVKGRRVVALMVVVFVVMSASRFIFSGTSRWGAVYQRTAEWLNATSEPGIAAGWAVGHIGFYSRRGVVNLEGLVGDESLLVANQRNNVDDWLRKEGVKYLLFNAPLSDVAVRVDPGWFFMRLRMDPMRRIFEKSHVAVTLREDDYYQVTVLELPRPKL